MSRMLLDAVQKSKALWRIGRIRIYLYSFAALWLAWSNATSQVDMTQMGWWTWFQTVGGCIGSWCLTMMAFMEKQAQAVASGHIPGLEDVDDPDEPKPVIQPPATP